MGIKGGLLVLIIGLFLISSLSIVSAISITPPRIEGNFRPGLETDIEYTVSSRLDRDLEFYAEGDLAQYITFNQTIVHQRGNVIATLKLPDAIEIPGPKRTYIGAREIADEEVASGGMGVAVAIEALILIHVPYPGKYLETELSASDANLGEPVEFMLKVISRGDEDLIMQPRIEVYSENDDLIEVLDFKEREVPSGKTFELYKILNTTEYGAGRYYAVSKIDYDSGQMTAESNASFRIGELVINIMNYSKKITIHDGMQVFWIDIENGWNDEIDGAFADVRISNKTGWPVARFRTSPTQLNPWEVERISGYFNSSEITPGKHYAKIDLTYYGRDKGRSSSETVEVRFVGGDEIDWVMVSLIAGVCILGGIVLLIVAIIVISIIKDGKKRKHK